MVESYCGLICTGCEYKESHGCTGCLDVKGKPFWGECLVAKCCQEKGFPHCGICSQIPCELLLSFSNDPEQGDDPPGKRIEQCKAWGIEGIWRTV